MSHPDMFEETRPTLENHTLAARSLNKIRTQNICAEGKKTRKHRIEKTEKIQRERAWSIQARTLSGEVIADFVLIRS